MKIQDNLQLTMKNAMKTKNKEILSTVRMIIDRVQKKEKDIQKDLTEEEVIQILQTFKKQIQEEKEAFQKSDNKDRVKKLRQDIVLIESFLPKQLSKKEVFDMVNTIVVNSFPPDNTLVKGNVMKVVMPELKGKVDNKTINEVVSEIIEKQKN